MRQVLRWIQSRDHPKVLGPLLSCEGLVAAAVDPADRLYKLQIGLKAVEVNCGGVQLFIHPSLCFFFVKALSVDNDKFGDNQYLSNCSWAQFLIIMSCIATCMTRKSTDSCAYNEFTDE